jgi:hypothetical protein
LQLGSPRQHARPWRASLVANRVVCAADAWSSRGRFAADEWSVVAWIAASFAGASRIDCMPR